MLKKTTNKKTIAIVVLAVLLVALIAFNATYAYFTDKVSKTSTVDFGIIDINATENFGINATIDTIVPGEAIDLAGTITAANSTERMWVKIGLVPGSVVLKYNGTELAEGSTNAYYDGTGEDGATYTYTAADVTSMKSLVETGLNAKLINAINNTEITGAFDATATAGAEAAIEDIPSDGIFRCDNTLSINLAGQSIVFDKTQFGNKFQNVTVEFVIAVLAVQTTGVESKAAAEAIFGWTEADFLTGVQGEFA